MVTMADAQLQQANEMQKSDLLKKKETLKTVASTKTTQDGAAKKSATSQVRPSTSNPQKPDKVQEEILSVLQAIRTNQKTQENRLVELESQMNSFYNDEEYCDYQEYEEYDTETDVHSNVEAPSPTPSGFFKKICTKYEILESVDDPVDSDLAGLINNVFREGLSDEKLQSVSKSASRPENCTSLTKTRVNGLIWNQLSPYMQTVDSKMQSIQQCIVDAGVLLAKLLDKSKESLESSDLEKGTDALGLLGHANKLLNNRRKESHKTDLNREFHYLCTPSLKFTEFLYGDDVGKDMKDIQDANRLGTKIRGAHRGARGGYGHFGNRGRGHGGVFRGKIVKRGRGKSRGSWTKNVSQEPSRKQ